MDGLPFEKQDEIEQILGALGIPERVIFTGVENSKETEYKLVIKKNNESAELTEEQKQKIDADNANANKLYKSL